VVAAVGEPDALEQLAGARARLAAGAAEHRA
jgi:hypothetical protein